MKKTRISDAGKIFAAAVALVATGAGSALGIAELLERKEAAAEAAAPANGANALVTEFTAAVSTEARIKMEEAAANVGKPDIVRKDCADVTAMMAKLSAESGISTKITVTPYEQPSESFKFGYCKISAGDETITFINDGDELSNVADRRYMINELIENLPADDILKIHAVLSKAPQP